MKMKVSRGLFHLEGKVLVIGTISYLYLIEGFYQVVENLGTVIVCWGLLFESRDSFIHNCIAHFCFGILSMTT